MTNFSKDFQQKLNRELGIYEHKPAAKFSDVLNEDIREINDNNDDSPV